MIPVSAAIRKASGLPAAAAFFQTLSSSLQRYHVDNVIQPR